MKRFVAALVPIALLGFSVWWLFSRSPVTEAPPSTSEPSSSVLIPPPAPPATAAPRKELGASLRPPVPEMRPAPPHPAAANTGLPRVSAGNLLRDSHGNLLKLAQANAAQICAIIHSHLPTMRELAALAQARGARGILEADQAKPKTRIEELPWEFSPDGSEENTYYLVNVRDPDGKQDVFYYNPVGYRAPEGDLGSHHFLSSSLNSRGVAHQFGINAANGVIGGQNEKAYRGDIPPEDGFAFCVGN